MDLSRYSVLEVGEYVAAPYAGKLLSDTGADVLKVEPPWGDAARRVGPFPDDDPDPNASGFFAYLNTGKRSVTLDPDSEVAGRVIHDLIDDLGVDVVLENRLDAFGVTPAELVSAHDGLVVVSVTGFGTSGPWQERDAPEIVSTAESGQMNKMGYPHRPPTRLGIKNTDYMGGQYGALAALSALFHRDVGGGPGQHVDVSKREAGAASMEYFLTGYSWSGHTTTRTGTGYPQQGDESIGKTIYETEDGHISAAATAGDDRWEVFCTEFLDRPELLSDERFETREARSDHMDEVLELVEGYTRTQEKWDLFRRFQAHGIPSAVTSTPKDIAEFEHLAARDFWHEVPLPDGEVVTMPNFPFRVNGARVEMARAPRLGEHDGEVFAALGYDPERLASTRGSGGAARPRARETPAPVETDAKPLSGIRIIDFTWVGAGPQGTKLLAALGADVVKIESLRKPDILRLGRGFDFDTSESLNVSAFFGEFNQGKRSIQLDLNTERGREVATELIREADVLAENFSPSFMERIDLEYEQVRELNPGIVYLSMPGWGKAGPARTFRSYGNNLQSMAGLDWITGFPDDPPTTSGQSWPDPVAGAQGAVAIAMALLHRGATGEGTYIELPQYEMAVSFLHKPVMEYLMHERLPDRVGNRDEDGRYVQGAYECAGDDRWAVVAVETDAQWERLCGVMGRSDLADDERFASQYARLSNHDAVDEAIETWTRERTPEEVRERLQDHDVPAGIVANERDLMDRDPQLRAREFFPEHDHPEVGTQRYGGVPIRMSAARVSLDRHPPCLGEHTEEVLAEWLGWDDAAIEEGREREILH